MSQPWVAFPNGLSLFLILCLLTVQFRTTVLSRQRSRPLPCYDRGSLHKIRRNMNDPMLQILLLYLAPETSPTASFCSTAHVELLSERNNQAAHLGRGLLQASRRLADIERGGVSQSNGDLIPRSTLHAPHCIDSLYPLFIQAAVLSCPIQNGISNPCKGSSPSSEIGGISDTLPNSMLAKSGHGLVDMVSGKTFECIPAEYCCVYCPLPDPTGSAYVCGFCMSMSPPALEGCVAGIVVGLGVNVEY